MKFDIKFYKLPSGKCPVEDFLDSLDYKMRAKILRLVLLLKENGNDLREPYSKYLEDGLFELRAKQGTNITRVIYFFMIDKEIVVTHGFVKKSQKMPQTEIELAKKYREDYISRKESANVWFWKVFIETIRKSWF